jgi:GGDEF domain-containing protein
LPVVIPSAPDRVSATLLALGAVLAIVAAALPWRVGEPVVFAVALGLPAVAAWWAAAAALARGDTAGGSAIALAGAGAGGVWMIGMAAQLGSPLWSASAFHAGWGLMIGALVLASASTGWLRPLGRATGAAAALVGVLATMSALGLWLTPVVNLLVANAGTGRALAVVGAVLAGLAAGAAERSGQAREFSVAAGLWTLAGLAWAFFPEWHPGWLAGGMLAAAGCWRASGREAARSPLLDLRAEHRDLSMALSDAQRELATLRREVSSLRATEPATGLADQERFAELLRDECFRARRYRYSLVMIGVTLQPAERSEDADSLLRRAAEALSKTIRASDYAGRIGELTLAVAMPYAAPAEAPAAAERLAREIGLAVAGLAQVTAAVASHPEQPCSPERLLQLVLEGSTGVGTGPASG